MLCLVTSPVVGSNAHKSLGFLMLIVRLFHVEHSVAVAAGAAFAVPLPWSPGGVGACELRPTHATRANFTDTNLLMNKTDFF